MDSNDIREETINKRRKGQTLAEFALTLPILLLLVFGIVEFARIFQAWVALQNAARTAARYATTGQFNESQYDLDTLVPCLPDTNAKGTRELFYPIPGNTSYFLEVFTGGEESLYATWYDGEDCDPGNPDDHQRRKDLLRILSIYDEARRGAAGLSIEANQVENTPTGIREFLYDVWLQPRPRSDEPKWFDMMICSSRVMYEENSSGRFDAGIGTRFVTVLDSSQDSNGGFYDLPYCMLNEIRPGIVDPVNPNTNNAGKRWLDAGGGGERVTVVVTFNHPLITPLGFAPYIQLQARRAAVNEAFQTAQAANALQGSELPGSTGPTLTPYYSETPPPTNTDAPTATRTPLDPTATETPTLPFSCDRLHVDTVDFFANRLYVNLTNENAQATELQRVRLNWGLDKDFPNTPNWANTFNDFPNIYLNTMSLESEVFWIGPDTLPNTDSLGEPMDSDPSTGWVTGANIGIQGLTTAVYEAAFNNGPSQLNLYVNQWDFGGSVFSFDDPTSSVACEIELTLPEIPEPTVVDPDIPTNTATYTPDCALGDQLRVVFAGWDTFGVVRLSVVNERYTVAPFVGFELNWLKRASALRLDKVSVGGPNPDSAQSVIVWQGPDDTPSTISSSDGTWLTNFTFPPNSVTPLYLDFGGTSSTLPAAFGVALSDYNLSRFDIGCGTTGAGGTGGAGTTPSGRIFLSNAPTPPPTNTPRPTNTNAPTLTPSITFTPGPPTATRTPAPPTSTRTPAPATATYTPTEIELGGIGGSGGSG